MSGLKNFDEHIRQEFESYSPKVPQAIWEGIVHERANGSIKNFDDHTREEFNSYAPQVPQNMWERIINERKKKRPVGFWFTLLNNKTAAIITGILLLMLAGAGTYFFYTSSNKAPVANDNSAVTIKNSSATLNHQLNRENHSSIPVGNSKIVENSNSTLSNNEKAAADNVGITKSISNAQPSVVNKTPLSLQPNSTAAPFTATNTSSSITADKSGISRKKHYINLRTRIKATSANGSVQDDQNNFTNISIVSSNISNTDNDAPINILTGNLSARVQKLLLNSSDNNKTMRQKMNGSTCPECPTVEKDAAGNKRYFEVYVAPDYGIRTLTDTANSAYLQKRKASAQFTSGYSAGVRYTKVFDNGMSVKAGLNFSQINERFSYVQSNLVQVTYVIVNGDTVGSYTVTGTRYKTTYNHYRSIDIPVTIGYEFGNGKFHANVNAGLIANIYSWQKGDVLDTNYLPVSITTGKASPLYQFKTNVGLGATGGVALYYKINDQLHFMAEPYLRYNFQPMNSANLTLRQKYTTIGLRLGLRFDLPNKIGSAFQ